MCAIVWSEKEAVLGMASRPVNGDAMEGAAGAAMLDFDSVFSSRDVIELAGSPCCAGLSLLGCLGVLSAMMVAVLAKLLLLLLFSLAICCWDVVGCCVAVVRRCLSLLSLDDGIPRAVARAWERSEGAAAGRCDICGLGPGLAAAPGMRLGRVFISAASVGVAVPGWAGAVP